MTSVTVLPSAVVPRVEEIWTIVVGGGTSQRFGTPKQYEQLGDHRVIDVSRAVAERISDGVVVVVPADDAEREHCVSGGATRSDSVRAGLAKVPTSASIICVHDAARPLASETLYERVIQAVIEGADGAVPGVSVTDTIKFVVGGIVASTPDRDTMIAVQTPQAFRARALREAHSGGGGSTDDAALVEDQGGTVVVVAGEEGNRKITRPDDLVWARQQMSPETGGDSR
jgi:2-C-methyl-D-erythritol 4-phosphate cytidylyltransferase